MATAVGEFSLRRLGVQIVLVGLVLLVAFTDFGNPLLAAVGFASGLLLVLAAVDRVREHPLYEPVFGVVIICSGVVGVVVRGHLTLVAALLVVGGIAFVGEWGYRLYDGRTAAS